MNVGKGLRVKACPEEWITLKMFTRMSKAFV